MTEYFFTSSTYPIFLGLYLKSKEFDVHFLYTRKNYKELFELLGIPATHIVHPTFTEIVFKPWSVKPRMHEVINLTKGSKIHFTHLQFSYYLFAILCNRGKNDISVFYNLEPVANNPFSLKEVFKQYKTFVKSVILQKSLSCFYNTKTILSYYSKTFYLTFDRHFFSRRNIEEVVLDESFENIQLKVLPGVQLNFKEIERLYIAQNEFKDTNTLYSKTSIEKLYHFIEGYNFAVKPHPLGYPHPNSKVIVPPNIPSEFFFNSIKNIIASINSTTLISASHYFWKKKTNVKVICLHNLLLSNDQQTNDDMQKRMKERCKPNVFYPKSYKELIALLEC